MGTGVRRLLVVMMLAALLAGLLTVSGPARAPASADAGTSPEWVPFVGTYALTATWSAGGYHPYPALDLQMPVGTPVYASGTGTVSLAQVDPRTCNPLDHGGAGGNIQPGVTWCSQNGFAQSGTRIRIDHPDGHRSAYLHLSGIAPGLGVGSRVLAGQRIGSSGNTGITIGPHLHYQETDAGGTAVDPGVMLGCSGRSVRRYSDPQHLLHTTISNDGYDCHRATTAASLSGAGVPVLGPTVVVTRDGRLQAFAVGADGRVHIRGQRSPGGTWGAWSVWRTGPRFPARTPVTVAANKDGRLQAFAVGADGRAYTRIQRSPNGGWQPWTITAGYRDFPARTPIAVATNKDGRVQAFAVGADGRVHTRGAAWAGYRHFPARTPISVVANEDGRLLVVAVGAGGRAYTRQQRAPGGGWTPWTPWPGYDAFPQRTPVSVVINQSGRLQAFAIGARGRVYVKAQRSPNGTWSRWSAWAGTRVPPGSLIGAGTNDDGRLQLVVTGGGGRVLTRSQRAPGGPWAPWTVWKGPATFLRGTPVVLARARNGRLLALAVGAGGRLYAKPQRTLNGGWSAWSGWPGYRHFGAGSG